MAQTSAIRPFEFDKNINFLADSSNLKHVPSKFTFTNDPTASSSDSIPIVDFSTLTTDDPDLRSKAIHEVSKACRDWGFFVLVNHGIPETLMKEMFAKNREFFNLPEDEKNKYEPKSASDPIKCGNLSLTNTSNHTFTLWRDYLRLLVHPDFHCPLKPQLLREVVLEYCERTRNLARKLMEAILETLELEKQYVEEALKLDSSFQVFATNLYPPCPQPDQAIGIPPHTDPGILTFLVDNGVAGLQIEHKGEWFNASSPHNSILVNVADHLEIFSNGRCKSGKHRAVVNDQNERISIVVANGPSQDAVVGPAAPLVERDGRAFYRSMRYGEYMESLVTKSRVDGKPLLEQMMIVQDDNQNAN